MKCFDVFMNDRTCIQIDADCMVFDREKNVVRFDVDYKPVALVNLANVACVLENDIDEECDGE